MKSQIRLAEAIVLVAFLSCLSLSAVLDTTGAGQISWGDFVLHYLCALGLIGLGTAYRVAKRSERLAAVLIITGLYIAFTNSGAKLNYFLYPSNTVTIDVLLMRVDAYIGFDWRSFVFRFEDREMLSAFLRMVYFSSLVQLFMVILFLGFTERERKLHEFMLVGVVSSLLCILIWSITPSFGPAYIVELPPSLIESLHLAVDAGYVMHLNDVAGGKDSLIEPTSMRGLIAFPSMHTVMALMAVVFTFGTRAMPFFLAINIPMIPAILLHGGHHVSDVIAGMAVFFVVLWLVQNLMRLSRSPSASLETCPELTRSKI
ncbi:MAG: phosphatase PAP2 family protein [Pelagibaca sp.]